jgi:energy-coupling factor transporter ATP-binding protein EcfA2
MTPSPSSLPLAQLSLRERERGFVLGGTGTGKTTLADLLGRDFLTRYQGKKARRLILDTKPRYRAQWETSGVTAQRRYRHWGHGQVIADSVAVSNPSDLERAFGMATTVIVQGAGGRKPRPELCAACVQVFHAGARSSRPQLLQVDEVRDHYHSNGAPFGGFDAIGMAVTGGRELGESVLICSQRTKGIPPSVMEELTKLYLFRLDFLRDAGRLQEMGAPITLRPPRVPFVFKYWTKADYEKVWGPYKLDL